MENIKQEIFNFISKHEVIISHEMDNENVEAKFTTFGNRAGCRAIYEIIELLDEDMKIKIVEMMKNKRIK